MAKNDITKNTSREDKNEAKARPEPKTGSGAGILLAGGLALGLAGAALIALPIAAKPYAWIATSAERHGVAGLPIALAGLVLCGLWIAARSRRDATPPATEQPDEHLLLEQVASDLAHIRGGMQDLRVEFVYLKDQVLKLPSQIQPPQDTSGENSQAAVFRLAASVDQLSGRMEHLLRAQEASIHGRIGSLEQSVRAAQVQISSMEQRLESATTQPWAQDAHAPHGVQHAGAQQDYDGTSEPQIEIEEGYRASPEDVDVWVEFEPDPNAIDLGLLDRLDDAGTPRHAKTSPSIAPPTANETRTIELFDRTSPNAVSHVRAALPSPQTPRLRANGAKSEVEAKLELLRELMSDSRVREAIANERHGTNR